MRNQLALLLLCSSCGAAAPVSRTTNAKGTAKASAPTSVHTEASPEPTRSMPQADSPKPEALRAEAERLYQQAALEKQNASAWHEAAMALARASKLAADEDREREFLRSALSAWQEVDRLAPASIPRTDGDASAAPRALPDWELVRLAVLARLAQLTPLGDPEATRIAYRRGRILWSYDHHTKAAASLRSVIQLDPQSPEAEFAAHLLLDTFVLVGDLPALHGELATLLANKQLLKGRAALKVQLELVRHQVDRRSAEKMAQAENYHGCAEAYLNLYRRDRRMSSVRVDELLYNASVCLERAGRTLRAVEVLRELVKKSPHSPLAAKARERAESLGIRR